MSDRMKRKIIIVLGVLLALFLSLTSLLIVRTWAAEGDPFIEIGTAEELKELAADSSRWNGNFKLTANINLNGSANDLWSPIGNESIKFTGIFDGDGHTISGLYIENSKDYQGLFGYVTSGIIKNLHVNGTVNGGGNMGGIVGTLYPNSTATGTVENCSFEGMIDGGNGNNSSDINVGGIVGHNHGGTIKNCRNSGTVQCGSAYAGGIVGFNEGLNAMVIDCENTGEILLIGDYGISDVGGIVGYNSSNGRIMKCSNKGNIGKDDNYDVGGIVGSNISGSVTQCYNTGNVIGNSYVGGIVGQNSSYATIQQCYNYNTGAVSGTSYIGGIVGQNDSNATVTNCYNKGSVSGRYIGGVVGRNFTGTTARNTTVGTVTNCYNRGTVTGNNSGGVVGQNANNYGAGTVTNCYYLTGTANGGIAGSDVSGQAEAKADEKFKSGEVAWLLQKGNTENVWGQELIKSSKDENPLLIAFPEGTDGAPDENRTAGDNAVPIVVKISFFVPNGDNSGYMQLSEDGSSEYYARYSNENGTEGDGIGGIKIPTHSDHRDVPENDKDGEPIVWLVNDSNSGREFDTVMKGDIIWGDSKYNEIYLYVKWDFSIEQLFGCLTIRATGGRPNESFLYHITGTVGDGGEIDLTVSVKSDGSARILVPLGEYTVTEISDWSWRYGDGAPTGDGWAIDGKTAATTIEEDSDGTYGGQEKIVTFSHERKDKNWLGGENFRNNDFE